MQGKIQEMIDWVCQWIYNRYIKWHGWKKKSFNANQIIKVPGQKVQGTKPCENNYRCDK